MARWYYYNARRYRLIEANDMIVVRTHSGASVCDTGQVRGNSVSAQSARLLRQVETLLAWPDSGVEVLRVTGLTRPKSLRDKLLRQLTGERDVRFAGRVLCDPTGRAPVVYTENLFVKFYDDTSRSACRRLLRKAGLKVKRALPYAHNAYFACATEGTGQAVFTVAAGLLEHEQVECAHPELVREISFNAAAAQQWHLHATRVGGNDIDAHANVVDAWSQSRGDGVTIAVIDDGVDIDHNEFRTAGKIVAPLNTAVSETHPLREDPRPGGNDSHGTACAGVACANGTVGASGVAPDARLMPIRLRAQLGSQAEADSFFHAASRGADVISCSWGPVDGLWFDPSDPAHDTVVPLPDSTRLAIDFAVNSGRNGRGCVICWAAGNGNESVENDGYASYGSVIAVAACNDLSTRSAYSDIGPSIWCAFPSSDGDPSLTPGIWTTDRSGQSGYNPGRSDSGDVAGDYTSRFGGTSSACPGAAGVAALVLARDPDLSWAEVRDILRRSAEPVDAAGGGYDAQGHSDLYGYGRLDAAAAVDLAAPAQAGYTAIHTALAAVAIQDNQTARLDVEVGDTRVIGSIEVAVEIEHTWIGDLRLQLVPPAASGAGTITLRERSGGSADNISERYSPATVPALGNLVGTLPTGTWRLRVDDNAQQDQGLIRRFSVELGL